MAQTVIGVFDNEEDARHAIGDLKDCGYDTKDISVVMKDVRAAGDVAGDTGARVAGGAVSGAATGAAIGGLAGLLIGIGAIAIPGLGAILVGGPLAAALGLTGAAATTATGAATGAIAGGLIGALMALGLPEQDARRYEERIRAGGILVAVPTLSRGAAEVNDIMDDYGATDIKTLGLPDADETDTEGEAGFRRRGSMLSDDEESGNRRYAYHHRNSRRRGRIK